METIKYYIEVRSTQKRTYPPFIAPLEMVDNFIGFRSVFAYPQEVVDFIKATSSTRGINKLPVYCDTVFMDFDSHDPVEFREWLKEQGWGYSEWDSGGRSVHFHIPIQPILGEWVPRAVKTWVREKAPTADISFYHHAGIYRLPGTFHAKRPGSCKRVVVERHGPPLVITQPTPQLASYEVFRSTKEPEDFYMLVLQTQLEGGRRPFIWRAATVGFEAGLSYDEICERLLIWNQQYCQPSHEPIEVIKQIDAAYRRIQHAS